MRKNPVFGVKGMTSEERAAANPYLGRKVQLGGQTTVRSASRDENLRAFMLNVYNYMIFGLVLTGLTAFLTYSLTVTGNPNAAAVFTDGTVYHVTETEYLTELGVLLWISPLSYVVCFGPLALLLFAGSFCRGLGATTSLVIFMAVAFLIGVSFSGLALSYTNASMTSVFFSTAAAFGGLSLVGYTTNKDLSGWGSFLWMGFFGLVVTSIISVFMDSGAMQFAISGVGVLVFSGFTVYDTQMIKEAYSDQMDDETSTSLAINGALDLYLDFVHLFRFLLHFLGEVEE